MPATSNEATWQSCWLGKCYRIMTYASCHLKDSAPYAEEQRVSLALEARLPPTGQQLLIRLLGFCLIQFHHVQKPFCTISTIHPLLICCITQTKKILERYQHNLKDLCKTSCGHGWLPAAAAFSPPSFHSLQIPLVNRSLKMLIAAGHFSTDVGYIMVWCTFTKYT